MTEKEAIIELQANIDLPFGFTVSDMELDEHNFYDEPHHYLCPMCKNIVDHTQNYYEECGQALDS